MHLQIIPDTCHIDSKTPKAFQMMGWRQLYGALDFRITHYTRLVLVVNWKNILKVVFISGNELLPIAFRASVAAVRGADHREGESKAL
jgi:hypothetical protein